MSSRKLTREATRARRLRESAIANIAFQALQRELPTRQPQELTGLLQNFRQWFRGTPDGTGIEDLTDGVLDIAPELFDDAILGSLAEFQRQALCVWNDIY